MQRFRVINRHIYWRTTGVSLSLLCVLFYLPISHFFSLAGFHFQFSNGDGAAIWFSIWQGLIVAVASCCLALIGAMVLYHRHFVGAHFLRSMMLIPFFIPGISIAIGFHKISHWPIYSLFISHSHPVVTVIFAEILVNTPVGVGLIGGALKSISSELLDAMSMDGANSFQRFKNLTLPHLTSAIKRSFLIIFFYSLSNLGIILAVGDQSTASIESQIYSLIQGNLNIHHLATLAIIQSLISVMLFFTLAGKGANISASFEDKAPSRVKDRKSWRIISAYIFVLFCTLTFFISPIELIIHGIFNPTHLWGNLNLHPAIVDVSLSGALFHTVRNALIAGVIGVSLSLGVGVGIARNSSSLAENKVRNRFSKFVETFSMLPLAFSPLLIGLGFLLTFTSGMLPLRESWISTPIAQSILGLPLSVALLCEVWKLLPREFYEEGILSGADALTYFLYVELPLLRPAISRAFAFLVLISIADFSAAAFLSISHQGVLTTIFQELISHPGSGNYRSAELINLFFILIATTIVFLSDFNVFHRNKKLSL